MSVKVYPLVLGPVQTSCYIISNHERAVVVDPAANANQIIQYLGMKKLKLEAIFLTHGHFDHIGAVNELVEKYQVPIYAHKKEKEYFEKPEVKLSPMIYERLILNPDFEYSLVKLENGEIYVLATELIDSVMAAAKIDGGYEIIKKIKGSDLELIT